MKKKVEDLGFIGIDGQLLLIKAIIEDKKLFSQIYPSLEQNLFSEAELKTIVGLILDYYKQKGLIPSYSTIEILIRGKYMGDELEVETLTTYLNKIKELPTTDIDAVTDISIKFLKQQKTIYWCNKLIDTISSNGYKDSSIETYTKHLQEITTGMEDCTVLNPIDVVEEVLSEGKEIRIPTGIDEIDNALNGGLAKGSAGMIQGNAGCGKTTISTLLASNAAVAGYKVMQIYFEDKDNDIIRKHYAAITDREINEFTAVEFKDILKPEILNSPKAELIRQNLKIVSMPTGIKTVEDIEYEYRRLINEYDFKADLIIIDYFDCLKKTNNPKKDWLEAETSCMRKIENLAKTNDVAVWTMQQGNRNGENSNNGNTIQGAYTKKQIASVYITIFRGDNQMENNLATIVINKNRQGAVKTFENVYFNNGTVEIKFDNEFETEPEMNCNWDEQLEKLNEYKKSELYGEN